MADLQETLQRLPQFATTLTGLLLGLTAFFHTCLVPFLHSLSEVFSALRKLSKEGRLLVREGQRWWQLAKLLLRPRKTNR